ncbi:hypothetical protein FVEN_g12948 [Fusarium venenatum]|uniref:uncharacterized protein n=1 Tax=Fusarium venenatum TaxID=56646 RepID=UPI001DD9B79E|nr:hypothetical protein FVEN_g12948 [Fusarium venenatum]KAH7006056.1 hypothetical protein EDB82DRAFT_105645 [Fusarium venenatum]
MSHVSSPQFCLVSLFSWVICSNYHLSPLLRFAFQALVSATPIPGLAKTVWHENIEVHYQSFHFLPFTYRAKVHARFAFPPPPLGIPNKRTAKSTPLRSELRLSPFFDDININLLESLSDFTASTASFLPPLAPVVLSFQPPFHSFRQYLLILLHPASSPQISDSSNRRHTR